MAYNKRVSFTRSRLQHSYNNRLFRKARRRYVYHMRNRINTYKNDALDFMVDRMKERGLYAEKTSDRSIRQSILCYLYKMETGRGTTYGKLYSRWLEDNQWDMLHGYADTRPKLKIA